MKPTADMFSSPYDRGAASGAPGSLVQLGYRPKERWVPSRFNARTVGDDGGLILWNTSTGAITTFPAKDSEAVLQRLSPAGVAGPLDRTSAYLEKRGYLVPASANELDRFRFRFGQRHWRSDALELILLASEDCNFRCVYCYEKFQNGTMLPEVREGVRALVRRRAPQLKQLNISWFGGEPLYGWEAIEDLAPFFKETVDRYGLGHLHHMTTNAYLLTEERATRLLEWGCRHYQITVDGLPEEHDCKRVGRDGSPTYHVILDNLRALKARSEDFTILLRVNFDNHNFTRLGGFLEALSEDFAGDRRFQLHFRAVGRWGGDNDENLSTCGTADRRTVVRDLRRKAKEADLHPEGGIEAMVGFGSQVCYAARPFNFLIGATGKVMKCTVALDTMDENVVGQLLPDGELQLKTDHLLKWVSPHFESDALCQHCYALPICHGAACPLTRVSHGHRTCCGVKSELKTEMRYTLAEASERRAPAAAR
jgi:uncharacterized protein